MAGLSPFCNPVATDARRGYAEDMGTTLTIELGADGGATLWNTTRTDAPIIKSVGGWKWSRNLGGWYLPRTWRANTVQQKVDALIAAFETDGQTVTVGDEAGQPVDVLTRKIAQAENRAAALEAKAERTHEQAEALHADWKKRADLIPMGQPMLTDHYSYRADVNNRNRLQAQAERVHDTHNLALERDRKAAAAARTAERLGDPIAQTRRLATVRKELAALGKCAPTAVNERQTKLLRAEEESLVAALAENPVNVATREMVQVGDIVHFSTRDSAAVVRVNSKSVSVGSWIYGRSLPADQCSPGGWPLIPKDPDTGKAWRSRDQFEWLAITRIVRDGVTVWER